MTGEKKVESDFSMLTLSVGSEMAPGFRLLVFHLTGDGEIVSDSCFLPVDGFSKFEVRATSPAYTTIFN